MEGNVHGNAWKHVHRMMHSISIRILHHKEYTQRLYFDRDEEPCDVEDPDYIHYHY